MNKVIEISLIENRDKKKKIDTSTKTLLDYKTKIINDLEDIITLKFFDNNQRPEIRNTDQFIDIRNSFVTLYNTYIEINKYLIEKTNDNKIVKDIIDELIENVIKRVEGNITVDSINRIPYHKEVELIGYLTQKPSQEIIDIAMIE